MIHTIFIIIAILYSFKVQSILLIILSLIFLGIFIFSIKKFKTLKNTLDIEILFTSFYICSFRGSFSKLVYIRNNSSFNILWDKNYKSQLFLCIFIFNNFFIFIFNRKLFWNCRNYRISYGIFS